MQGDNGDEYERTSWRERMTVGALGDHTHVCVTVPYAAEYIFRSPGRLLPLHSSSWRRMPVLYLFWKFSDTIRRLISLRALTSRN